MTTLLAMESQPLKNDCVDSDDGLSPRLSGKSIDQSLSCLSPRGFEPQFLSASNEEIYEDSPRPIEVSSATAKIVSSIYGEVDVEMKASDITQALEAMALNEGSEVVAFYGARLATFEELLDPENVDPIVTREECFVALQRWHKSCDCHVVTVNGIQVPLSPEPPGPDDEDDSVVNCTLSPCCRRVPNEEVIELRHQNKTLRKTIDGLQFQLTTNEKKLNHLKDEKLKLVHDARELRSTMDRYYGYKADNEVLEKNTTRLNAVVLSMKRDLIKANKERDDFKRQTNDLSDSNNELAEKLDQSLQNEALLNNVTSRKLAECNGLQARLDDTLAKLSEKEMQIAELVAANQQYEERFVELRRSKERRRSEESDCNDNVCRPGMFDTAHAYGDDFHEGNSSAIGGMSLFAEMKSANEMENMFRQYQDASTSYELVTTNRASQTFTPVMEDHDTQTRERGDDTGMYAVNGNPTLTVMDEDEDDDEDEEQSVEFSDNIQTYLANRNSTPDEEYREIQTPESIRNMTMCLLTQNSTPYTVDQGMQTLESIENAATQNSTPDEEYRETQAHESIENIKMYLFNQNSAPYMVDHGTQTLESIESAATQNSTPYMVDHGTQTLESESAATQNSSQDMEDCEAETIAGTENIQTYLVTENSTPHMEDHATQTVEVIESVDTYIVNQNATPYVEDRGTQTVETIESVDTYLVNQNATPYVEDRGTQTVEGVVFSAQNARPELPEVLARDARTTNTYVSTLVMDEAKLETRVVNRMRYDQTGVMLMPYRAVAPLERDRTLGSSEASDRERRRFRVLSSDAGSDGGRRYTFADGPSLRVNCEEKSPETSTAPTNTDVDGSGDASYSAFGGVEDVLIRDAKYASNPSPRCPRRGHQLNKRACSDKLRRNDAHVALDREMALLGVEIEGVSRSARRQFAVVGRALERALEASENYGRVVQELRFAKIAEGRTRSAATMTVMFPLRRSVSEPPVGLSSSAQHGPVRRRGGGGDGGGGTRRANRPPPPISEPAPPVGVVPNAETAVGVTRRQCDHHHKRWRIASCVLFVILSVVLVFSCQSYECRTSRVHGCFLNVVLDQLERYGYVKRSNGPRPM